jgi:hypothetical protein
MDDGGVEEPSQSMEAQKKQVPSRVKRRVEGGALKEASFQQPSVDLETCFSGPQCASHELQWPSGPGQQTSSFPTSEVESCPYPVWIGAMMQTQVNLGHQLLTLSFLFLCVLHLDFPSPHCRVTGLPTYMRLGWDAMQWGTNAIAELPWHKGQASPTRDK